MSVSTVSNWPVSSVSSTSLFLNSKCSFNPLQRMATSAWGWIYTLIAERCSLMKAYFFVGFYLSSVKTVILFMSRMWAALCDGWSAREIKTNKEYKLQSSKSHRMTFLLRLPTGSSTSFCFNGWGNLYILTSHQSRISPPGKLKVHPIRHLMTWNDIITPEERSTSQVEWARKKN